MCVGSLHALVVNIDYSYWKNFNFSAWLSNRASPVVARLSRLIEAVTNLSMETAEDLQVCRWYFLEI